MEIKKLNEIYKQLQWDELQFDVWEAFTPQRNLSPTEIILVREFLEMLQIDGPDECLISFRATPSHMGDLLINYLRLIQFKYPGIINDELYEDE